MLLAVDLSALQAWMKELRINMTVQSISEELDSTKHDNQMEFVLPLEAQADISIRGYIYTSYTINI